MSFYSSQQVHIRQLVDVEKAIFSLKATIAMQSLTQSITGLAIVLAIWLSR